MSIFNLIKTTFSALGAHKMRSALASLGIIIGISSVIIIYAAMEGLNGLILSQVESFGSNLIETEIRLPTDKEGLGGEASAGAAMVGGTQVTSLTLDDMEDINRLPNVARSYAGIMGQELLSAGSEKKNAMLFAVSPEFIEIDAAEMASGRFFDNRENDAYDEVIVLGSEIKETLFGVGDAVGKQVKMRGKKYRVVGVLEERGQMMTLDFDNFIYIPVKTAQKKLMGINHVLFMFHEVIDNKLADDTSREIRYILRENHNIDHPVEEAENYLSVANPADDFRVTTMDEMISTFDNITDALEILLMLIISVSLIVGGVGIMNIMYVIVSERTGEIGLRKAVGASESQISRQFLFESIIIALIGGILGVLFGLLIAYLISFGAVSQGLDWQFGVPVRAYVIGVGFSVICGIVFGVYPAKKAAKLDAVEALRRE